MPKSRFIITAIFSVLAFASLGTSAQAQSKTEPKRADLSKAKDTVNRVRQSDAPKVGSGKQESAKDVAKRENAAEKQRQKEVAKKYPAVGKEVPSPGRR